MRRFFRIVQAHWVATAMDGEGARRFGGRWNEVGVPAVYLAESRALAALEILVHAPREALALEWRIIEVQVPADLIENQLVSKLPAGWRDQPSSLAAQRHGSRWIRDYGKLGLLLPSVIIPEEGVLLLNSRHPDMRGLKVSKPRAFDFDPRLPGAAAKMGA
ncbi:MAG: RES family NAD+ phosphorylase [Akkermansiaceae bacterium]